MEAKGEAAVQEAECCWRDEDRPILIVDVRGGGTLANSLRLGLVLQEWEAVGQCSGQRVALADDLRTGEGESIRWCAIDRVLDVRAA